MTQFVVVAATIGYLCHWEERSDVAIHPQKEGEIIMDFYKVPIGFGMALAMNQPAMNAYAAMTEAQKQVIVNKAHNVRSEREMRDLVASLAHTTMQ